MATDELVDGTVHKLPKDLRAALESKPAAKAAWKTLTPLARNEWICWSITVKQEKTRKDHVKRTVKELQEGKRRPCCWIGCIHRLDKPMSPSVKWALNK